MFEHCRCPKSPILASDVNSSSRIIKYSVSNVPRYYAHGKVTTTRILPASQCKGGLNKDASSSRTSPTISSTRRGRYPLRSRLVFSYHADDACRPCRETYRQELPRLHCPTRSCDKEASWKRVKLLSGRIPRRSS